MRVLWLKTELLHPIDKGGKIRTYAMLRELRRQHPVTYLTLDDGAAAPDAAERATEYCDEVIRVPFAPAAKGGAAFYLDLAVNVASPLPYAVSKYRSAALRSRLTEVIRAGDHDVLVCDFLAPSVNVPARPAIATVLFQHNVEAMIWARRADVARGALNRHYMRLQHRRMKAWEQRECRRFDHVIAVSDADRDVIRTEYGVGAVSSVPTGVDAAFFAPSGSVERRPQDIVFTGSMDWMPNEDGIEWFCRDVLPAVRRRIPAATLTVVGRNPSPAVRSLAQRYAGVEVTGTVPDVRPFLERAGALVVPLRVGGGTRLKVFEGMAMGRAIVSTTIGAEGLALEPGREILIADDPADFAAAVSRLLEDPALGEEIGRRAAGRVRRDFSWDGCARLFAQTCAQVVAARTREADASGAARRVPAT